jgi:hypothetical protein
MKSQLISGAQYGLCIYGFHYVNEKILGTSTEEYIALSFE